MSEARVTVEPWPFTCLSCGHQWVTAYEKRSVDFLGDEVVTWRRGGHPCTAPWSGELCPQCGGYEVTHATVG
jgi:hypothetical protein